MESFFFGSSEQQLYGVFHAANPSKYRSRSVLLLYPVGQEYMRIHRAFRRLADSLAEHGFDVLRFDYACTGNSHGTFDSASLEQWNESAVSAYDELHAMTPGSQIDVVGLRMGTVIARHLVLLRNVARLVVWEPKFSNDEYISELITNVEKNGSTRANFVNEHAVLNYNGFSYSSSLRTELQTGSWKDFDFRCVDQTLVLGAGESQNYDSFNSGGSKNLSIMHVDGPSDWTVVDWVGGLFLPEPSLSAIRAWLSQ